MQPIGKVLKFFVVLLLVPFCFGCAAAMLALEKKDLSVGTQMTDTIFLDADQTKAKTVFLVFRNTSGTAGVEKSIHSQVAGNLLAKGYKVVPKPEEASYIIQANILFIGKADPNALRSTAGRYGAPIGAITAGMVGGSLVGRANARRPAVGGLYGAAIGGIVVGAAEMIIGTMVKDVTFTMVTDLQISEKTDTVVRQNKVSNLKQGKGTMAIQTSEKFEKNQKYQTRVISTANQVNLRLEEAAPQLSAELANSIAGIF